MFPPGGGGGGCNSDLLDSIERLSCRASRIGHLLGDAI